MPPSDSDRGRCDGRDLDAEIDAFALRVERSIRAHRRHLDGVEFEPLPLTPLDHARSVLAGQSDRDAGCGEPSGDDNP